MNEKNKSLLIIVSTLLIGCVIGALIWSGVSNKRNADIEDLRSMEGMSRFLLERLEPTDEGQKEQLEQIIQDHGSAVQTMRQEMRLEMESFREELSAVLNADQQSKLDRILMRGDRRGRGGRPGVGPDGNRPPRPDGRRRRGFKGDGERGPDSTRFERRKARRDSTAS